MDKGGRPKDAIWTHFWCVKEGNKTLAKCKICSHTLGGKTDRMKNHLSKCKKPNIVQSEMLTSNTVQSNNGNSSFMSVDRSNSITSDRQEENSNSSLSPLKACKRPRVQQDDLDQFLIKTDSKMKHELDIQIARFFYSCNIPFNVAEQAEFLALIKKLRPGYKPPTRKALSENLLNEVTTLLENEMIIAVENKECTLIEDGWSNIHNDPVIASCLVADGKSYFLNAEECGSNKKSAEYCKDVVNKSIEIAEGKYKAKVISLVTDNENKMNKLRELIVKERSDMIVYGCSAHWLNLLAQDICPTSITKHVELVQKYFRNHHQPAGWLKEYSDSVKPQLPNDTRWNSQTSCISTYIKNWPAYLAICEKHGDDIDTQIQRLINDYNLVKQVKDLLNQLQPITDAMTIVQSDHATIADACYEWLKLENCPSLIPHKRAVLERMNDALKPFHFLAFMTDPKHRNENDEKKTNTDQKAKKDEEKKLN